MRCPNGHARCTMCRSVQLRQRTNRWYIAAVVCGFVALLFAIARTW